MTAGPGPSAGSRISPKRTDGTGRAPLRSSGCNPRRFLLAHRQGIPQEGDGAFRDGPRPSEYSPPAASRHCQGSTTATGSRRSKAE
ncbi:hypothetical protein GCM10009663_62500 [Kitasatospora arboriphila]|uniref:Uncharacterized protein n=1 Tax=Kitasatospora arboriphila TaxID=258052 RepID=A0ABN1U2U8_9ACTN